MKCPHCSQEHPDNTKFCPETGKKIILEYHKADSNKLVETKVCPQCGALDIPVDSFFCPDCGYDFSSADEKLEYYIQNERVGFRNIDTHEIVIPFEYEDAQSPSEGMIAVRKNGKWGFVTTNGETAGNIQYDEVHPFKNGMALVKSGFYYGFIDKKGQIAIPFIYIDAHDFSEGIAVVSKYVKGYDGHESSYWGAIDKKGRTVIDFKYFGITDAGNGVCGVWNYDEKGYIDVKTGKIKFSDFRPISCFSEGYAIALNKNDEYGILNANGNFIIVEGLKGGCQPFKNGLAICEYSFNYKKETAIVNTDGNFIIPFGVYSEIMPFREGMAAVRKSEDYWGRTELWGFINENFELIIPCIYYGVLPFSDGVSVVQQEHNGFYMYIDKYGKKISNNVYDGASPFINGFAVVRKREKSFFIEKTNYYIIDRNCNIIDKCHYSPIGEAPCYEVYSQYASNHNRIRLEDLKNGKSVIMDKYKNIKYIEL